MAINNIALQNNFLKRLKIDLTDFNTKGSNLSELYITAAISELEQDFANARDRHDKISTTKSAEATKYLEDDLFRYIRTGYFELWAALRGKLASQPSAKSEETSMHSTMLPQCSQRELKLPKIDIPEFSGAYDEWMNFNNLFTALVHNSTSLDPIHKLQYLRTSLKGEALSVIKNLELNDENYYEARRLLKSRFQHTRRLVNTYFKRIFKAQAITTESSKAIKCLLDNLNDCRASLNKLNVNIPDYVIIYHTLDILTTDAIKDWEESLGASTELPSLEEFLTFLEKRFRILEMTESSKKGTMKPQKTFHIQNVHSNSPINKPKDSKRNKIKPKINKVKDKCLVCKGNHFLSKCDEYSRMPQTARLDFIKRCRLCTNCLNNSHSVTQCNSRYTCRVCKKKHHTTLHRYQSSAVATQNHADNSNEETPTDPERSYHIQSTPKLLGTARVKAVNASGFSIMVRALIDPCSTDNYISRSTVKALRLRKYYEPTEVLTMGNTDSNECSHRVNLRINSLVGEFSTEITAAIVDQITTDMPSTEIPIESFGHLASLPLGDPSFNRACSINILLGVDVHTLIKIDESRKYGNLIAENTLLGYLIRGSASNETTIPHQSRVMLTRSSTHDLEKQIRKFWETEELNIRKPNNPEDNLCEEIFQSSLNRSTDGRLSVKLPFKQNKEPTIGPSRFMAVRRFLTLEKKLENNSELKTEYHKQIRDYITSDHLVKAVNIPDTGKQFFLPHHAVIKDTSSTTKVRIVFDASCKSSDGTSLNDHLMTGPKLQTDIRDILFAWRQFPIPLTADIEKMYRMFGVNATHHDYQRIVWRFNPTDSLEDWKLTTITFGTSSAPYQAIRLLNYIAENCEQTHPLAARVIKSHFYVDDCISGGYTIQEAIALKSQLLEALQPFGLNLRKWSSSCKAVLDSISPELLDTNNDLIFDETEYSKTLGVCWSKSQDSFHFNIDLSKYSVNNFTKREVLSLIARLYDPLGFVSPCTMLSKQVMQRIWQTKSGWDEQVEDPICKDFSNFLRELNLLSQLKIPRWINTSDPTSDITIFGFCDASTKGYGAVIYLLNPTPPNSSHKLLFLSSKTKVADLKYESIARLELNGAVLLAELLHWAITQFRPRNAKIFAFCDSQIVLAWLQSNPAKWKTYVANRATQILNLVNKEDWYYVDTKNNPADFASRGLLPSEIINNDMWWFGPNLSNLQYDRNFKLNHEEDVIVSEAINRKSIVLTTRTEEPSFINKYSNHTTMKCKTKYIRQFPLRILQRLLEKINTSSSTALSVNNENAVTKNNVIAKQINPSATDCNVYGNKISRYSDLIQRLHSPESIIFRVMQQNTFIDEIKALTSGQPIPKKSKLIGLFPFIDKLGILRVGGRLQHSDLSYSQKHPIIMHPKHQVTKNIIHDAHDRTLHGSELLTLAFLRNRYHIPRATEAVKQIIHKCNICFRYSKTQQSQLMGSLPPHRLLLKRAFQHSGVDYAGPINIKAYPGRCKKFLKCYVAVFVCLGSKALHLELVSDLSSNAFLAAFRRFTSRRGRCHHLYSDNATNFVGAARILAEEVRKAEQKWKSDLEMDFENFGTVWHFIPPASPNFGGLWEAGVKSIKTHLRKTIGTSCLTYEEMSTILIQIEGVLNSRPLCRMSNNPNEYNILTPSHFLIGEPIVRPVDTIYNVESKPPLNRWNHLQFAVQRFAHLWKRDYLQTLHNRPKNQIENVDLQINDLVLLAEDDTPATLWPIVIVDKLHPGKDGRVRVVTVRTSKGKIFKRPVIKLRKLPCNEPHILNVDVLIQQKE